MTSPETFVGRLRKSTRKSHTFSDKVFKVKLALTLNNDDVWSEGLLVFYEIFKFLENAMRQKRDENLGKLFINGLARTKAFDEDLSYYFGGNWRMIYQIREPVARYLAYLQHLLDTDPDMLIPYVYYLYMGLLSGVQLLKGKKELENIFMIENGVPLGENVITFGEHQVLELKIRLTNAVNAVAETMDEEKKVRLIKEGIRVFELNDSIMKTIESPNRVLAERGVFLSFGFLALLIVFLFLSY